MFPQFIGCGVFLTLVVRVVCLVCMKFVVFSHIWVVPNYVVNVFAAVMFCFGTYVGILSHILAWGYQLFVFVNPTLF